MTAAYKYRKDCMLVWSSSEGRGHMKVFLFLSSSTLLESDLQVVKKCRHCQERTTDLNRN